jgi:hypothetical protein
MPSAKDLGGQRFGRWFVLHRGEKRRGPGFRGPAWVCECECGTMRTLQAQSLLRGASKSCGCLQKEILRHRNAQFPNMRFGRGWQTNGPRGADAPVAGNTNDTGRGLNDTGRGLSSHRIREHADWYVGAGLRRSPAAGPLDAELREILRQGGRARVGRG